MFRFLPEMKGVDCFLVVAEGLRDSANNGGARVSTKSFLKNPC